MKLLSLTTGKDVAIGAKLLALTGEFIDHIIEVKGVDEPDGQYPDGRIKFDVDKSFGIASWRQLHPRVLDCIFIEDDSLVSSVTYDNEKSVGATIKDILKKLRADHRVVRTIYLGYREWDKIRDLDSQPDAPATGKVPPPRFSGVLIKKLQYREKCLAFEHGPA